MSKEVDERVVEMRFDNRQFENNVSTSMSTLDKLKESLRFKDASKGFDDVDKAAKKVDMTHLGKALDSVKVKFSALEVMGMTALSNITNSAINAGKRISSAFTIEPIKTGLQEYETQINAVQTILANTQSKGSTLNDVNKALDELNKYADMTIYNFTEMTRNIGTFTAAGVDLDTSVSAIKGIANLAAISGSNSQQASTAMYQLSQALASGSVKLQDWNSVVNAGMGGQVFQDSLKETARAHGIAIDAMIKKEGSFRETLKNGWLSSEVLTETLAKFTGDLSAEQLKSMGYTEKQVAEIIKLGQTANDAATKVKTFTQLMDTLKEAAQSGWTQTWEILIGDFEEAKALWTGVSDTLSEMINSSAEARNNMLQGWKDGGGRTMLIDSLKNAFEGLMSIIKPIREAFKEVFPPMTSEQLLKLTEGLKNLTEKFKLSEEQSAKLKSTFKGLFSIVKIAVQIVFGLIKGFASLVKSILPAGNGIMSFTGSVIDFIARLSESVKITDIIAKGFEFIGKVAGKIANGIKNVLSAISNWLDGINLPIFDAIVKAFHAIKKAVSDFISGMDVNTAFSVFNGGIMATLLLGLKKFINSLSDITSNGPKFVDKIKGILDGVTGCFKSFQEQLKAGTIQKIAISIGILAASLFVLSTISPERMAVALSGITTAFGELFGFLTGFEKILGNKGFKNLGKVSTQLIKLSAALLILSVALKIMSTMTWDEIAIGLTTMAVSLAAFVGTVNLLPEKNVTSASKSLTKMASALLILSVAMKIMATMSWEEIGKGLATTVGGLAALVGAAYLLPKDLAVKAVGVTIFATSMVILAGALKIMATMSWDDIARSLVTLAGSLVIIAGAMYLMPGALVGASALLIISVSLTALAGALKIMATMSWEEIARGLTTLAGSLIIIAGAMYLMSGALPGAAALIIVAGALAILAPVIMLLSTLSWDAIVRGLTTLAGALLIIGVAGLVLGPITPALLALGGAIALIGVGCLAAGVGVLAFSAGITALGIAFTVSGAAIIGAITSLLGLIPLLAVQIGLGIVALVQTIANSAVEITAAVVTIITAILDAVIELCPKIAEAVTVIITEILGVIQDVSPDIVDTVVSVLSDILDGIVEFVPKMVEAGMDIITGFLEGIAENIQDVISAGADIIVNFLEGLGEESVRIVDAGFNMIIDFINGLTDSMNANSPRLESAISGLMDAAMNTAVSVIKGFGGRFLSAAKEVIGQLISGIQSKVEDIKAAIGDLIQKAVDKIKEKVNDFLEAGKNVVEGLINGIKEKTQDVIDALVAIAKKALDKVKEFLGIKSPSVVFEKEVGRYIVQGIAEGIKKDMSAEKAAEQKAKNIVDAFKNELDKIDLESSMAEKKLKLWSLTDGKNSTIQEANDKQMGFYNTEISRAKKKEVLAHDEWVETKKYMGENSKEANEAFDKYLDAQIEYQESIKTLLDFIGENKDIEKELSEELLDSEYELWKSQNKNVSDNLKTEKQLDYLKKKAANISSELVENEKKYRKNLETLGENSIDTKTALKTWLESQQEMSDIMNEMNEVMLESKERARESIDLNREIEEKRYDLWSEKNKDSASDAKKDKKELENLNNQLNYKNKVLRNANSDYLEAVKQYGKQSNKAKEALLTVLDTEIEIAEIKNNISDVQKNAIERENENLKTQLNLASETSDLKYQMWDKTYGRNATAIEKSSARLLALNEQLIIQSKIIDTARNDYLNAVKEFDESSNEAQSAYNNYLKEQLELANLQNEIADIHEATVEREKNAHLTYNKYIEKYKQYYLKNGMTLEDLERDARLTSGYDPNNPVKDMLDKATDAMADIESNAKYKNLLSDFKNIGTSYADAVNESLSGKTQTVVNTTIAMIDQCATSINEKVPEWTNAGVNLVTGLADGIQSKVNVAVSTTVVMINTTAVAILIHKCLWTNAGASLVDGFVIGIKDNIYKAVDAANELADATERAMKSELRIASPSKVFMSIGMFAVMGLVKGLTDNSDLSEKAASNVGNSVIDNLRNSIKQISDIVDSDMDTQPTIRPVLDLSNVRTETARLNAMFSRNQAVGISASLSRRNDEIQNGVDKSSKGGNTFQFTQNNYSPKALSRTEIYRQTKNQFAAMKGALV